MTNFQDFELAEVRDNPGILYEVGDGVIPEIAERFQVPLNDRPEVDDLRTLVKHVGKKKVLQENIPGIEEVLGADDHGLVTAADWIDRAGTQLSLDRSLWTPDKVTPDSIDAIVLTGAVANWQDRTRALLEQRAEELASAPTLVLALTGTRVMNASTEGTNPHILQYQNRFGELPTESDFMREIVGRRLEEAGYDVRHHSLEADKGRNVAGHFAQIAKAEGLSIETGQFAFARVANAGIQLTVQMRRAVLETHPGFDQDPGQPQAFVLTDALPAARTQDEKSDSLRFQNPYSGLPQVIQTARYLLEAAQARPAA